MFRFASPYFFLLLLILPLIAAFRRRRQMHPVMHLSCLKAIQELQPSLMQHVARWLPALKYIALCLMIAALARPQWGTRQSTQLSGGINIVLAVDLSESMAALDFKYKGKIVNRLEAIKTVVQDFIAKRNGDRIALVVFGTHAYTQVPLTRDYNTIASILDRLKIGAAGPNTAIGDAIGISLKRMEDIKSKSNLIILLTDGDRNSGELSPQVATDLALQKGVKIDTIGVGTQGLVPFLVKDPVFGERYINQQVSIDEDALKEIARKTSGQYFKAENTEGLQKIYDTISTMEKTDVKIKTFAEYNELYPYLLIPAFMLIGVWIVLTHTRFLSVP
jgi:Ca-activated chloride channel homolog